MEPVPSSNPHTNTPPTNLNKISSQGRIQIGDRKFRIRQVTYQGQKIDLEKLKSTDQKFQANIIKLSTHIATNTPLKENKSSHKLLLSHEGALVNGSSVLLSEKDKKVLSKVEQSANQIIQRQKTDKIEEKKHTFKKQIIGKAKSTAIKVGVCSGVILASPLIIALGLAIYGGLGINKLIDLIKNAVLKTDDLFDAAGKMKDSEETNKLTACRDVYARFNDVKIPNIYENQDLLKNSLETKLERHVLNAFFRAELEPDRSILNALKQNLKSADFADALTLKAKMLSLWGELEEVMSDKDIEKLVNELKATQQNTLDADSKAFDRLKSALEKDPIDPVSNNREILTALREVILSSTYQAVKENPDSPYVKLISHLSSAMWNEAKALSAYTEFGATILKQIDADAINQNPDLTAGEKRRKILEESRKKTGQAIYSDHGLPGKILYAYTHPKAALGSLASLGGVMKHVSAALGGGIFDNHKEFRNNPSLQGVTSAQILGDIGNKTVPIKVQVNNCYGGSPTIEDTKETLISPEMHAVCQACENNYFASIKDAFIPNGIYYTNFQNCENLGGEGERSFAIMDLNKQYPQIFLGITLSKDSSFYRGKGDYKDAKWEGAQKFGEELLEHFSKEKCFQYGNRTKKHDKQGNYTGGNGIYLPWGPEFWIGDEAKIGLLPKMIEHANIHFEGIQKDLTERGKTVSASDLRSAYQEYIYSMMQAYLEMHFSKELAEKNQISDVRLMAIRACKENIDRGGAENAKYLHTRIRGQNNDADIVGVMEARAISVKGRTILEDRLPPVLSFIEHVVPEEFEQDMLDLYREQNLNFAGTKGQPAFQPAYDIF